MHIKDICRRSVVTCQRRLGADKVAQLMRDQFAEEVVVVEDRAGIPVPVGVVTFRDMVVRVVATGASVAQTSAADIMTSAPETLHETELIYAAVSRMRSKKVSRLVVIDAHGGLVGVLTADDVADFLASELTEVLRISPHRVGHEERAPQR
jgi:CBS domain-containing protein